MNEQPRSTIAAFLATFWGKLFATLIAIWMLIGIWKSLQDFFPPPRAEESPEKKRALCIANLRSQYQTEVLAAGGNGSNNEVKSKVEMKIAEALNNGICGPTQ